MQSVCASRKIPPAIAAHLSAIINYEFTGLPMENAVNTLAKQGQGLVDAAADKVQGGIRDAGATLSNKVDDLRGTAAPMIRTAAGRAQAMGRKGLDAAGDVAENARDAASSAAKAVIRYTKENPVKALLIAAASGALLLTLAKVVKSARD